MSIWQKISFTFWMAFVNLFLLGFAVQFVTIWLKGPHVLFVAVPLVIAGNIPFLWLYRRFHTQVSVLMIVYAAGLVVGVWNVIQSRLWWGFCFVPLSLGLIYNSYRVHRMKVVAAEEKAYPRG